MVFDFFNMGSFVREDENQHECDIFSINNTIFIAV